MTVKLPYGQLGLAPKVLSHLSNWRQFKRRSKEAGGVLLGTHKGSDVLIVGFTTPTKSDKRSRYGFSRSNSAHSSLIEAAFKASTGRVDYVGEWHTHPENHPFPSNQDLKMMASQFGNLNLNPHPLVSIIVGRKSITILQFLSPEEYVVRRNIIPFT